MSTTIKTASDLKRLVESTGSLYFTRKTMKFFGDSMSNYGIKHHLEINVFELYRRKPVKNGNQASAYFDDETGKRVYSAELEKKWNDYHELYWAEQQAMEEGA